MYSIYKLILYNSEAGIQVLPIVYDINIKKKQHEYSTLTSLPRVEPRKDLLLCLHRAKSKGIPRLLCKDRGDEMPDVVSIHMPLPQVHVRAFPLYLDGDHIRGAGNLSDEVVLVERSSLLVMMS
jgi:IS30 family transposase